MTAPLSLEEARRDVRARKAARTRAENALMNTRGCSVFVHPWSMPGCPLCEEWAKAERAIQDAEHALEAAQRRLEAVESQVPEVQWIGGERS